MKKLLSLPPNLVGCFHEIENVTTEEYFCTSDPIGKKLGSGGGTNWLLKACKDASAPDEDFSSWIGKEKRILLHAGGQSRRLPSYAPSGKVLTPIPVFRWKHGQKLGQNLLSMQLPLYERIMRIAPSGIHTLIASGDVYIRAGKLQQIPNADVICYGLWVDPYLAKNHGVFCSKRETPDELDFMLQKPSVKTLGELTQTHLYLMDVGIWLLSDRAVELLMKRSTDANGEVSNYDLYSEFGCALGVNPKLNDPELASLSVKILPLPDGEFYHYGTSREMISSTVSTQNLVLDQRAILHLGVKPHPSIFIQNSHCKFVFDSDNHNIWIENSYINKDWRIASNNIITGVPVNDWKINLSEHQCVDVIPINDNEYVLRSYGFNDAFRGALTDASVEFLGMPVVDWLSARHIDANDIAGNADIQRACLFPISDNIEDLGHILRWMLSDSEYEPGRDLWQKSKKISADDISAYANLRRLQSQRMQFRSENLVSISSNHKQSVFYQLNLDDTARQFAELKIAMPKELDKSEPLMKRINDQMFRSKLSELNGNKEECKLYEKNAFTLLREGLTSDFLQAKQHPVMDVYSDQIVWGRSPVRIDLAGGWTDTPPYCLTNGGNVVNLAIELNGQPPLQTYIKPCKDYKIILRSIDLGAIEEVKTYEELADYARVGSPFSIPKAALCLAGFLPKFSSYNSATLEDLLKEFGCGIELTLLSAIPAGSGLGTSSILASTVLGAISDFCGLHWDKSEICNRTLVLEQLLTTGGGWQDQYGGVLSGVKLLRTGRGFEQTPEVRWLPDNLFNDPEYSKCHLLYYTGITRTAKYILADIVRRMFLHETNQLDLLSEMKEHAMDMYKSILKNDFEEYGRLVDKTWQQNKKLDSGTNPPAVEFIISQIKDLCHGLKLPGAGGGGYLYIVAKDPTAAARIIDILSSLHTNSSARFVNMSLSKSGLQVSRS